MLFFGNGMWLYAKAQLAQVLLERAWVRTLHGEQNVKPWSWADTWPVARLEFPRQHRSYIVLAGASGRTLAFGPGHVDGTAAPEEIGNCVISAHRDTQFRVLRDANLALLRSLKPEQWKQYGMHSERGQESVEHIVRMFAGHDVNHIQQIERTLVK